LRLVPVRGENGICEEGAMEGRRRFSPREKLEILLEGLGSENGVAEVCRRRGITTTQFYTWRKQLMSSAGEVFGRKQKRPSRKEERQEAELRRMRAVIAEITAENLDLKKTFGD
jgi:transposase